MKKKLEKLIKPIVFVFFIVIWNNAIANAKPSFNTKSTHFNVLINKKLFRSNIKPSTIPLNFQSINNTYCSSFASTSVDANISKVQLDSESNASSSTNGYEDFTGLGAASLIRGGSKTITITPSWPTGFISNAGYNYGVWIDYNMDGDFDDAGEKVFTRNATNDAVISGVFTVPSTSPLVTGTRMRVIMSDATTGTSLSPCGVVSLGQVEDYAISVFSGADVTPPTTPALNSITGITSISANLTWTLSTDNIGVTGYDIYRDGSLIASTNGATSYTVTNLLANTTYTFAIKARDAAGNVSNASNTQTITTLIANPTTYCNSFASSGVDANISKAQLDSESNISSSTNGYEDFTGIGAASMIKGATKTITITPSWPTGFISNAGYNYGVWIDYNKNNSFDDAGEKVLSISASKETLISGSFIVPSTAVIGSTRMRISMSDATTSSVLSPCGSISAGQVEDYTVNISSNIASTDVIAPTSPVLNVSNLTSVSAYLSWSVATDNVGVTGYDVFQGNTLIKNTTSNNYTVTGLQPSTNYSFTVKARDAAGNVSNASNTQTITTLIANPTTYCNSFASSGVEENISKVVIGYTSNLSFATTGYEDFTYVTPPDLIMGSTIPVEITPNWPKGLISNAGYNYSAWIDYNKNNSFDDAGEKVLSISASKDTLISGSFIVPSTAAIGSTRMRISMSDATTSSVLSPCGSISAGQVEDYTVNISSNIVSTDVIAPTSPVLNVANVTSVSADLSWSVATDNVGVTGYDVFQGNTLIKNTTSNSYTVTGLQPNTNYSFTVKAKDAAGNVSNASNTQTITTLIANPNPTTYCSSSASSGVEANISKVQLDSESNISSSTNGYEDFTSLVATSLVRGSSKTITITPNWPKGSSNAGYNYGVWIDYNKNNSFDDAGEKVFTKNATKDAIITGVFTVPSASPLVTGTRMRVIMSDATSGTLLSPCGSLSSGQVEDYTVNISSNIASTDVIAPTSPVLNVANVTSISADLSWSVATDNVGVTGYDVFQGNTLIKNTTSNNYTVTGLQPNTNYSFTVKAKDAAGNVSNTSNVVAFKTLPNTPVTLTMAYPNPSSDGILRLENPYEIIFSINVKNATGKSLLKLPVYRKNINLNLSQFGPGIYFIEIALGNKIEIIRVISLQ
jgi:chitodextrinase